MIQNEGAVCCFGQEIAWNSSRRKFPTHFFSACAIEVSSVHIIHFDDRNAPFEMYVSELMKAQQFFFLPLQHFIINLPQHLNEQ